MQTVIRPARSSGFTLIELMTAVTIAGILAGIAIPNMRNFLQNNRIASTGNDLLHSIQIARTEAIKRQQGAVTVCATADSSLADAALTCSFGNFSQWFVYYDVNSNGQHDAGEAVLGRGAASTSNTVKSNQNGIVCFGQTGFAGISCGARTPTNTVAICDSRGNVAVGLNSTARALFISQTGRARISPLYTDVTTAATAVGGCP